MRLLPLACHPTYARERLDFVNEREHIVRDLSPLTSQKPGVAPGAHGRRRTWLKCNAKTPSRHADREATEDSEGKVA